MVVVTGSGSVTKELPGVTLTTSLVAKPEHRDVMTPYVGVNPADLAELFRRIHIRGGRDEGLNAHLEDPHVNRYLAPYSPNQAQELEELKRKSFMLHPEESLTFSLEPAVVLASKSEDEAEAPNPWIIMVDLELHYVVVDGLLE